MIVRIPIIITVACRDYTVSPGDRDVIPTRGTFQVSTGQQTVNTDQDKDLTPLSPAHPHTHKGSRVTMVRGARHVPPIVGLHHPGSAAHPVRGQMSRWGLRVEVTSQQLATL